MNKKLVAVIAAVLAIAAAVWFFVLRDKGDKPTPAKPTPAKTDPWANAAGSGAKAEGGAAPMQGMAPRWIRDADKEGPLRLEGQVVDEHGDPMGGAIVSLGSVPPRTATSEQDGSFAFDKLVGREYSLSAVAGNLVGGPITYHLTANSDPVVLRLVAGAKLVVTVVDGAEKPVPKAHVKLVSELETPVIGQPHGTATADDGVATLEPVHPGWVVVQVTADGYALGTGFTQIGGAGGSGQLKVVLRAGFSISGRVIDDAGKPIKGVQLTTATMWGIPGSGHRAETDAKGTFTMAALPPGTHTLVASDGEHAPARSAPITIDSKAVTGVEITMLAGGTLAGTVVDGTGKPAGFATVRVSGDGQQMWLIDSRSAATDKDGAFELKGLARTKLKVRAESEAAASKVEPVDLTTTAAKRDLKLVLDVAGTISGIVVDETGAPVAEVQVNASPDILGGSGQDAMVLAGMSSSTTDGGGKFTIRGLPDGEYRVRAARSGRTGRYEWGQQGVKAKVGDTNVKITLAAPGSITGKVVLENGKPPVLANVQLGWQPNETAKPDGSFTITDVESGTYDLHVRGAEFAEFIQKDVKVAPGKPTDVGTLTLMRGRKLTGKVVDSGGNPVAGARIRSGDMLYNMQGADDQTATIDDLYGLKTGVSDQNGAFTVIGIAKKATSVLADHPNGRSNAVEIPAGTDDPPPITLTLRGFGEISGKVTMQGKPVAGATITATSKAGGSQLVVAQTETDGSYALTKVPEGPVVISAMQQNQMGMSFKSTSVDTTSTAGKKAKVDIDIPVGSITLSVTIRPLPSNQVDSAQVFLMRGVIAIKTAKEINDAFLGGKAVGMKFWLGADKPLPEFDELVAGDYSVCSIPITGDLNNPTFQQRLQENLQALMVYCKQAKVATSPNKQSFTQDLPAMTPLPN